MMWGWRVAQWVLLLQEVQVPSTYIPQRSQLPISPVPGDPIPSSGLSEHPHIHGAHIYMQGHIEYAGINVTRKKPFYWKIIAY